MGGHPTAPLLAAILAVGEKVKASGKDLLLSYILGLEVETKIGLTINKVHYNLGWHPTATLGTLGAAAACAKVMNLNREQILMALGMAGSQASALKQNFGTMTKPLHVGQAAKNGVLSALLASKGWTDREILEGHFGFCNLFAGRVFMI
jgi:2-methylcitrate dehydratase PrpD